MANTRVMSAPMAILKSNGLAIGKAKSIRCTETIRRQPVQPIGKIVPDELVPTGWSGTMSVGFFMVDMSVQPIPGMLLRNVQTVQQFEDTLILQTEGIQVDIMRKVIGTTNNGLITPALEVFASVKGGFIDRESFDINEGQISGRDTEFQYINPILFPV